MGSDVSLSKAVRSNLLSLQNTAGMMDKTQSRLATGNKVNSALDNPSSFFTASALNSRAADMTNLLDSMASGIKVIEAANNGLTSITKNIESMQSTLRQARQDKSFQTKSFDVTDASVLTVSNGRFDSATEIKLQAATDGTAAAVASAAAYTGVVPNNATLGEGFGARQVITLDGTGATDTIKIAGKDITIDSTSVSTSVSAINTALNGDPALVGKYQASAGTGANAGKLVIETVDPFADPATVQFGAGIVSATKGVTTIKYDAANVGVVTANGQPITTGTSFDEFVSGLQAKAKDGNYDVTSNKSDGTVTLTSKDYNTTAPTVAGVANQAPATPATKAVTTFQMVVNGSNQTIAAQELTIAGASGPITIAAGSNAAAIQAAITADSNINTNYDVAVTTGGAVSITAKNAGASTAPTVTSAATAAVAASRVATGGSDVTGTAYDTTLQGLTGQVTLTAGSTTLTYSVNASSTMADMETALENSGFTITRTNDGIDISRADGVNFTLTTSGASAAALQTALGQPATASTNGVAVGATNQINTVVRDDGDALVPAVNGQTNVNGTAGAFTKTVAAATDDISITYGDKSAKLGIKGLVKAGPVATVAETAKYQADTISSINDQLKAQGIEGVRASFSSDGKLSLTATSPEVKTLAVSGENANSIFGSATVATGKAAVSGYSSTGTVDKFVEEINRSFDGKLRATNDNGKLRIENLSTDKLDVSFDKDGVGVGSPVTSEIAGNSVRANLSKQFNDLRDQLDKLADDSSFNGINLLRGDKLTITFNESGSSSIGIQAKDKDGNVRGINAANLTIDSLVAADLDTDENIDALLTTLQGSLSQLRSQASTFGSNLSSVENRQSFTKNMINTLETGAANLTLADTNEEAANILALQTRQQLSSSALSMASQQDQAVLQLLR